MQEAAAPRFSPDSFTIPFLSDATITITSNNNTTQHQSPNLPQPAHSDYASNSTPNQHHWDFISFRQKHCIPHSRAIPDLGEIRCFHHLYNYDFCHQHLASGQIVILLLLLLAAYPGVDG